MASEDPEVVSRRVLWISGAIAAVFVAGIVLFFLFAGDARPLADSAASITRTTAP